VVGRGGKSKSDSGASSYYSIHDQVMFTGAFFLAPSYRIAKDGLVPFFSQATVANFLRNK